MSRIFFAVMCGWVLFRYADSWRRAVGVLLVAILTISMVFPPPAHAQFGLLGGIQNILNIINGAIRSALNLIGAASQSMQALYQQVVWPVRFINQAKSAITSLVTQSRGAMQSIYAAPARSATLAGPVGLESIIRNRQTNDFENLTRSFSGTFGAPPIVDQADSLARNMIDIDDGLALDTFKTLKSTDRAADLILESGNQIEDGARAAAPGSAPFLSAVGIAASIQGQAMMQKMLAAMLRQEAARIAHENALRKRHGTLAVKVRQSISDVLRRP